MVWWVAIVRLSISYKICFMVFFVPNYPSLTLLKMNNEIVYWINSKILGKMRKVQTLSWLYHLNGSVCDIQYKSLKYHNINNKQHSVQLGKAFDRDVFKLVLAALNVGYLLKMSLLLLLELVWCWWSVQAPAQLICLKLKVFLFYFFLGGGTKLRSPSPP